MKKHDFYFLGLLLLIGLAALLGFKLYENAQSTGNVYAKVFYQDQLILMIDLKTNEYTIYNTPYRNFVDVGRAEEGIFYVPGEIMTASAMAELWVVDEYAKTHDIIGIKLLVQNEKIEVDYQVSPKDLCELQPPTNSSLEPIVCLPNKLVINVVTNLTSDQFIPDAIME